MIFLEFVILMRDEIGNFKKIGPVSRLNISPKKAKNMGPKFHPQTSSMAVESDVKYKQTKGKCRHTG